MADIKRMAYITKEYYEGEYSGMPVKRKDFEQLAELASNDIDAMTHQRIRKKGIDNFSADTQHLIKRATCAVMEALIMLKELSDISSGAIKTSETIGSYSYSITWESIDRMIENANTMARRYLESTGLLYAGVS
jgi:uncharacterized protein Yka (UPF0111/DUF47 family)